jgi:hypothetical protein
MMGPPPPQLSESAPPPMILCCGGGCKTVCCLLTITDQCDDATTAMLWRWCRWLARRWFLGCRARLLGVRAWVSSLGYKWVDGAFAGLHRSAAIQCVCGQRTGRCSHRSLSAPCRCALRVLQVTELTFCEGLSHVCCLP